MRHTSHCPIAYSLDLIGDRWTLLVLRDLLIVGKRRFGELLAAPEGIATNILSARLRRLEAEGLLRRERDPDNGRQVLYTPTPKALDLLPAMLELVRWAARHDSLTAAPRSFVRRIAHEREALIDEIRARHPRAGGDPGHARSRMRELRTSRKGD